MPRQNWPDKIKSILVNYFSSRNIIFEIFNSILGISVGILLSQIVSDIFSFISDNLFCILLIIIGISIAFFILKHIVDISIVISENYPRIAIWAASVLINFIIIDSLIAGELHQLAYAFLFRKVEIQAAPGTLNLSTSTYETLSLDGKKYIQIQRPEYKHQENW